jgi:hypothetical protein
MVRESELEAEFETGAFQVRNVGRELDTSVTEEFAQRIDELAPLASIDLARVSDEQRCSSGVFGEDLRPSG